MLCSNCYLLLLCRDLTRCLAALVSVEHRLLCSALPLKALCIGLLLFKRKVLLLFLVTEVPLKKSWVMKKLKTCLISSASPIDLLSTISEL